MKKYNFIWFSLTYQNYPLALIWVQNALYNRPYAINAESTESHLWWQSCSIVYKFNNLFS